MLIGFFHRFDSETKADWLGTASRAYMRGEITFHELQYLAHYLERVFTLVWLDYLAAIQGGRPRIALDDALALEVVGFYVRKYQAVPQVSHRTLEVSLKHLEMRLELSEGGWKFIQHVFGLFRDDDHRRHSLTVSLPTHHW